MENPEGAAVEGDGVSRTPTIASVTRINLDLVGYSAYKM